MENGMQETQTGVASLETDRSIFCRFAEFIYTGDYNPAPPTTPEPTSVVDENSDEASEDETQGGEDGPSVVAQEVDGPRDDGWRAYIEEPHPESEAFGAVQLAHWQTSPKKKKSKEKPTANSRRYESVQI